MERRHDDDEHVERLHHQDPDRHQLEPLGSFLTHWVSRIGKRKEKRPKTRSVLRIHQLRVLRSWK